MNREDSAAKAIADQIKARRPRFPPILRVVLGAGLGCLGGYVALLAFFYATERALFDDMLRLYGLTLLAGREPAMFAVYQPPTPVPLGWMLIVAVLDDVGTLLLTLPWVWYAFERLRGAGPLQEWLMGLEKTALENRRWIRRWGLAGLAAFYWIPGFGSGVLAICVIGVLSHIPLRRLVPTLVVSAGSVAMFWALALYRTSALLPEGPVEWVPSVILGAFIGISLVVAYRRRRSRHVLLLEWPAPEERRMRELERFGFAPYRRMVKVDSRLLAQAYSRPSLPRTRAHALAELLLLEGMTPEAAAALEARGVHGILDVATLDGRLLAAALREANISATNDVDHWVDEAKEMLPKAESAWLR